MHSINNDIEKMAAHFREAGKASASPQQIVATCPYYRLSASFASWHHLQVGEAEVMAEAGISDILIANEVVGPRKIERLMHLATRCDIMSLPIIRPTLMHSSTPPPPQAMSRILVEGNIGQ